MNYESIKEYLSGIGQLHLLEYYGELDEEKRRLLLEDIESIDFSIVDNLEDEQAKKLGELRPVPAVSLKEINEKKSLYEQEGIKALKANKVGAVLLAGGQGTRLGFDKPKGMFNIGVTRELSIFGRLMQNIKDVTTLTGVYFPLFIMTSVNNNDDTVAFFRENNYFGYPSDRVFFYIQETEPTCDFDGKVFLENKHTISRSPNGNGGWYSSLVNSGCGKIIKEEGIEWLNVFGVDNVLQRICDPAFIGATVLSGCVCSSKVVKKTCAEERVGVLCEQDGKPSIIEYYDMPSDIAALRDNDGELTYRYGVILNYLFNVDALEKVLSDKLPYHVARKAIPHMEKGVKVKPEKPNGCKFETLVVDMIRLMGSCLAYEVEREREFAPVKNKTGVDSVDSARKLLELNGVKL